MRHATLGQSRERNPRRHIIAEALRCERLAKGRRQHHEVGFGPGFEDAGELRVKGYPELRASLALHHANGGVPGPKGRLQAARRLSTLEVNLETRFSSP